MGWMQKLYETYESCQREVGRTEEGKLPLLPIYHTTQQAQIEAVVDSDGNWCPGRAQVILNKNGMTTIIPCTESSGARTSGLEPHPLFDKLQYIAGDFETCVTGKKSGFQGYITALADWCASPYAHPNVRALYAYLQKGTLMADLMADGILFRDETGALPAKWAGKKADTPSIFKACAGAQTDAFVRFRVVPADGSPDIHSALWQNPAVWQSYIDYENHRQQKQDICYVRGEELPVSTLSPKKIRNPGDGAKLISSNDTSNFTFRGRFRDATEAFCIGRETTEKAHSALRWLISRQGWPNGEQVIVTWGTTGKKLPDPCADALDLFFNKLKKPEEPIPTKDEFAARLRRALSGYICDLQNGEEATIMGLDSATPGRLSVFYYREMQAVDFLARVQSWHDTCGWAHDYGWVPDPVDAKKRKHVAFVGAPSPKDIVFAAYGPNADDKLKKNIVQRLLPCIIDGARLPRDIMLCAVHRASNPVGREDWEVRKTRGIACALIRKYHNDRYNGKTIKDATYKEVWAMALDKQIDERDYLFGRALAYAQKIESYALDGAGEKRSTNAERLQTAFCQHPARTWLTIDRQLRPYLLRLGKKATRYHDELNEILSRIPREAFTSAPLSEKYLLGYACQMQAFHEEMEAYNRHKKEKANTAEGVQE